MASKSVATSGTSIDIPFFKDCEFILKDGFNAEEALNGVSCFLETVIHLGNLIAIDGAAGDELDQQDRNAVGWAIFTLASIAREVSGCVIPVVRKGASA